MPRRLHHVAVALALLGAGMGASAEEKAAVPLSISRLDCGDILIKDFDSFFSDAHELPNGPWAGTDSCYLIRHGDDLMLWEAGFPAALRDNPIDDETWRATLDKLITEQLAESGIAAVDIDIVGISHMHLDHVGQVNDFPGATLVVGRGDFTGTVGDGDPFTAFRGEGAKVKMVGRGDLDIFGDGSVIALSLPGHTPHHLGLLLRLESGPVMLSGDLYHSREAREVKSMPSWNTDRADTMASMDRFEDMAKNLNADVVIQHDPDDFEKIPNFPAERK